MWNQNTIFAEGFELFDFWYFNIKVLFQRNITKWYVMFLILTLSAFIFDRMNIRGDFVCNQTEKVCNTVVHSLWRKAILRIICSLRIYFMCSSNTPQLLLLLSSFFHPPLHAILHLWAFIYQCQKIKCFLILSNH